VSSSADIFAGQGADEDTLAALYDLEHDDITEDLGFYRELARRHRGAVLDLGCGSGRLFRPFLDGGARTITGVDGSGALLRRAELRIAADRTLARAAAEDRISLVPGDVRAPPRLAAHRLIVLAGVLSHLDGPDQAVRALAAAARRLAPSGKLVIDTIGPGGLPTHDLPLTLDWEKDLEGRPVVRRSQLARRETPEGLRVDYMTLTDTVRPDGTIARLPASYRLWYPSRSGLAGLLETAGLVVESTYGSHDLDPFDAESERLIVIAGKMAPGT
jgi:SAM-dependent methyltransferase